MSLCWPLTGYLQLRYLPTDFSRSCFGGKPLLPFLSHSEETPRLLTDLYQTFRTAHFWLLGAKKSPLSGLSRQGLLARLSVGTAWTVLNSDSLRDLPSDRSEPLEEAAASPFAALKYGNCQPNRHAPTRRLRLGRSWALIGVSKHLTETTQGDHLTAPPCLNDDLGQRLAAERMR